jgi:hypothetical protein
MTIKSKKEDLKGHVARMGNVGRTYTVLVPREKVIILDPEKMKE